MPTIEAIARNPLSAAAFGLWVDHELRSWLMFRPLMLSALYFAAMGTFVTAYALVPA
jgi:hypothetical protein